MLSAIPARQFFLLPSGMALRLFPCHSIFKQLNSSPIRQISRSFTVLAVESSADDTCAAIVHSSRRIYSNVVIKQNEVYVYLSMTFYHLSADFPIQPRNIRRNISIQRNQFTSEQHGRTSSTQTEVKIICLSSHMPYGKR